MTVSDEITAPARTSSELLAIIRKDMSFWSKVNFSSSLNRNFEFPWETLTKKFKITPTELVDFQEFIRGCEDNGEQKVLDCGRI
jgi:hypothetical protein